MRPRVLQQCQHFVDEAVLEELRRADVDGEGQVGQVGLCCPDRQLGAGGAQHSAAQRQDEAGFLGQRNEQSRPEQPAPGVMPAHRRLGTNDAQPAIQRGQLRLVVQHQLAPLDALAQFAFQLRTARCRRSRSRTRLGSSVRAS